MLVALLVTASSVITGQEFSGETLPTQSTTTNPAQEPSTASKPPKPVATARPVLRPPYLAWDEDWLPFCEAKAPSTADDRLKCLAWNPRRRSYVTVAGELRQEYEAYRNQYWGDGAQDPNGWILQHYLLSVDWHIDSRFRLFGELQSGLENGRDGGPRSYDKDKLDIHQFFLDYRTPAAHGALLFRAGRQELSYGSGRLVNTRSGLNTRISFDGLKVAKQFGPAKLEVFGTRPTFERQGYFNDVPDSSQAFWGAYFTAPLRSASTLDLYYFGLDRKQMSFNRGEGRYTPETFGGRWSGKLGRLDYDDESNFQVGRFGVYPVRAWSVSTQHGFVPSGKQHGTRIAVRADVSSGDRGGAQRALGTFNPLFARGKYFQGADLNGPSNTVSILPATEIHPAARLTVTPSYGAFWRYSTTDGVYSYSGRLLRPANGSAARLVGQMTELDVTYDVTPQRSLRFTYEHFFPGRFLRQAPPGRAVDYVSLWFDVHF